MFVTTNSVRREPEWVATGVIEAPLERVLDLVLRVEPGKPSRDNAFLMSTIPGVHGARVSGGPATFDVHYGQHVGGRIEVDRGRRSFAFQGGFKFRGEYWFDPHERGTLLTYKVFNVAPASHRENPLVRLQFRLAGRL
jgi:hypothetical protein